MRLKDFLQPSQARHSSCLSFDGKQAIVTVLALAGLSLLSTARVLAQSNPDQPLDKQATAPQAESQKAAPEQAATGETTSDEPTIEQGSITKVQHENSKMAVNAPLRGEPGLENTKDYFGKLLKEGLKALNERRYEPAQRYLESARKEANRAAIDKNGMVQCRLALANLYLVTARQREAYGILRDLVRLLSLSESQVRKDAPACAGECFSSLAEADICMGKLKDAEKHAKLAIKYLSTMDKGSQLAKGIAYTRLARAMSHQGFSEEAKDFFERGRILLEQDPGPKELDLADALRYEAVFYQSIGSRKIAAQLFAKACSIKEACCRAERSASMAGQVVLRWEPGSPLCHEIIDQEFPLRYITAANVRVAVTTIDLWELLGLLICVTNTDEHRRAIGFGDVKVYKVTGSQSFDEELTIIPPVDPKIIDRLRRERNIWDLTQDRPWLANIQKNRNFRGFVPHEGHDLFRGPNLFGVWREWQGISHIVPTRVTIFPSRENVFSEEETDELNRESGLIRSQGLKQNELMPISMEPYESRTGELFYIYPRDENIEIQITTGNTSFRFPFHCRKRRIP